MTNSDLNTLDNRSDFYPNFKFEPPKKMDPSLQPVFEMAEELFVLNGFEHTSLTEIADLSGVGKEKLSYHFVNEEDLLIQLVNRASWLFQQRIVEEFNKANSSLEGITRSVALIFEEFYQQYPNKLAILYRESMGKSLLVSQNHSMHRQNMVVEIKYALDRVSHKEGFEYTGKAATEIIAISIMSFLDNLVSYYLLQNRDLDQIKAISKNSLQFVMAEIKSICQLA